LLLLKLLTGDEFLGALAGFLGEHLPLLSRS
jgi:hypothetical protein